MIFRGLVELEGFDLRRCRLPGRERIFEGLVRQSLETEILSFFFLKREWKKLCLASFERGTFSRQNPDRRENLAQRDEEFSRQVISAAQIEQTLTATINHHRHV